MDSPVEWIGIINEQINRTNTLDGIRVHDRLLHDQTGGAAPEVVSVLLQHVEERTPSLGGFLQDHSHARAVAAGVGAASVVADNIII